MERPQDLQIVLTGFSGSGKTTVLKCLEQTLRPLGFVAIDLDDLSVLGFTSISDLIQSKGWDFFRSQEKKCLQKVLSENQKLILALGGGSLEQGREVLDQFPRLKLVHLKLSFEECWKRISATESARPLVSRGKIELEKLFEERQEYYRQSEFTVDASATPDQVALAIQGLLGLA